MTSRRPSIRFPSLTLMRRAPLAEALALALLAASVAPAAAQAPIGGAWFAAPQSGGGAARGARPGVRPGLDAGLEAATLRQQQAARQKLQQSVHNLERTASAIAAQQAAQRAAREQALTAPSAIPDGLAPGGLWDRDAQGTPLPWTGARRAVQHTENGQTRVAIEQTQPKAILNWDSFNISRSTTLEFQQKPTDAVLNRVVGAQARPSEIQGAIQGQGTVMVLNQNGVVFSGSSQVNVRNLVVAAATITDQQFNTGLYNAGGPTFTDALSKVDIQAGAQLHTHAPARSTEGGGYVLLLGKQVDNQGAIHTPNGQTLLAGGDAFTIRRGVGTDSNPQSTTRGNEVIVQGAGAVANRGLIQAATGDITLSAQDVRQAGVALATTSVHTRGTVHLNAAGTQGAVTLDSAGVTAIVLDQSDSSALDSQRDSLHQPAYNTTDDNIAPADTYRRDLSLVHIQSGGAVDMEGGSLTLATGGQIAVQAGARALLRDGAALDVSGALGVKIAMEDNNLAIWVQGNEQRDAPLNRDSGKLNSQEIWLDRRSLVHVPAGVNGYEGERWYTAGGLLEVGGYLATGPHRIGEWMAQGGIVSVAGGQFVAQRGSAINLSGGTLDVQSGQLRQSWLRGEDGRLYEASHAPADRLYQGLYQGYEAHSQRWGHTDYYRSPLIGAPSRYEPGYTLGRDAGALWIGTRDAVLEGDILGHTFQGDRQTQAPQAKLDGYQQSQRAAARGGQISVGQIDAYYLRDQGRLDYGLTATNHTLQRVVLDATAEKIAAGLDLNTVLPAERRGTLYLDSTRWEESGLNAVRIAAREHISVDSALTLAPGGEITLYAPVVDVRADLRSPSGQIQLGNVLHQINGNSIEDATLTPRAGVRAAVTVAEGVTVDAAGLWSNLRLDAADSHRLPWIHGGRIALRSSGDVTLGAGSLLDVSSGAALRANDRLVGGRGGDISVEVNANSSALNGVLSLAGELRGLGMNDAGTLDIQAAHLRIGGNTPDNTAALHLPEDFLQRGFAHYRLTGQQSLEIADGAQVALTRPIYRLRHTARDTASGQTEHALEAWLPELYQQDPDAGVLHQRAGASLTLHAGNGRDGTSSDPLDTSARAGISARVGQGSALTVDPGQSIAIRSAGQLTVDGVLSAWSGRIELGGIDSKVDQLGHSRSIWLGEHAGLDVAGRAVTALDRLGRRYGQVGAGGDIIIGGRFDPELGLTGKIDPISETSNADDLFVVLRPGARLDASGAQAVLDVDGLGPVHQASAGGLINLASANGLYLDGTLLAASGGAGAAGGHLVLALDTPVYNEARAAARVRQARELILTQHPSASLLPPGLQPDQADGLLHYGQAGFSVQRVRDGGFDSLTLATDGALTLHDKLDLSLGQALNLYARVLTPGNNSKASAQQFLAAPYVRLAAYDSSLGKGEGIIKPTFLHDPSNVSRLSPQNSLFLRAGQLLELRGDFKSGGSSAAADKTIMERPGYDHITLHSDGDLRFLGGNFYTPGDLTLSAAQLYPATHTHTRVYAGWTGRYTDFDPKRVLALRRSTNELPAQPYSVFGRLELAARTIEHGGVLRAPMGTLMLGLSSNQKTDNIRLLDGSITSVSAQGLTLPYGGTADGVTWRYDGQDISLIGAGSDRDPRLELIGRHLDVQDGALIDLSGGGALSGAGFVSGRGGSTDARLHPLAQTGPKGLRLPSLANNPVYAILPGAQAPIAPSGGETGAGAPLAGQRITLAQGDVPGLPAGTYTLLPSTYALLPGAFRVEIALQAPAPLGARSSALRNGSYAAAGRLSVAGTALQDSLPRRVILTPAAALRRYSQYQETSYADFARADATVLGIPRAVIEADGKQLRFRLLRGEPVSPETLSLSFQGSLRGQADLNGRGSTLSIISDYVPIEILSDVGARIVNDAVSVRAADLNRIAVNRLAIGWAAVVNYGQGGNLVRMDDDSPGGGLAPAITLRSGAILRAPEIMLIARGDANNPELGAITVESGAAINTLGQGRPAFDSSDGFIYQPGRAGILSVSNGRLQWLAPQDARGTLNPTQSGPIRIGVCSAATCSGNTQLYSDGSIGFLTVSDFVLDDAVRFGTRHLSLGTGAFNIGGAAALARAATRGALTSGLTLNQNILDRLLQGDTQAGAPALETLELIAGQSMNFFESAALSTLDAQGRSKLDNLLLSTPAIYGYGQAQDVAAIHTGHLIWNGATTPPPAVAKHGAGDGEGAFQIRARQISLGYGPWGQPDGISRMDRLTLGFAGVTLQADERITANNSGTLSVYQRLDGYDTGPRYQGGRLEVLTPLWTGESGSVNKITAGGAIHVQTPAGGPAATIGIQSLGGELSLNAGAELSLNTAVALPSGKLTLTAQGDLRIADDAYLDLAGRAVPFFDDPAATQYSWGGDVILSSAAGNIDAAAGSTLDLSAAYNQAGSLSAVALAPQAGGVDLQSRILGAAGGDYDAGGTRLPYLGARLRVQAQHLGGDLNTRFAALNQRLNQGQVHGLRAFQIKQGDLIIGDDVRAHQVDVSLDGGHLTVAGAINAGGARVGGIRLAGARGLTLGGQSLLDAHGTLLRLDSYGKIIAAPNRAVIELSSGDGVLTLAAGARLDLRHGTDDARVQANPALHDGRALGTLALYAPRLDAAGQTRSPEAARHGDLALDARSGISVLGAQSVAVHAVQRYDDARFGDAPAAGDRPYQIIDQDYLNAKHADSVIFIERALTNAALRGTRLAGLDGATLHLRPGVEIVSATPDNDIIVSGDLDLSGHRYDSLNPAIARNSAVDGSGEPGALAIRAGGNLSIYGSINDGFAPPPDTPDDQGWVLTPGVQGYGSDVIVPGAGIVLAQGTRFATGKVLNYDLPIQALTLPAGIALPVAAHLNQELRLPAGTVLSAAVYDPQGNLLADAGALLEQALTLPSGSRLGAGFRLLGNTALKAMTWPAGTPLPGGESVLLAGDLTLPVGALIPSMTDVKLPGGAHSVALRPLHDGRMGRNWAIAAMLPEGSLSWGLRLVAGADLAAADPRLTRPDAVGTLRLADAHYSLFKQRELIPGTPAQPGGAWYWSPDSGLDGPVPPEMASFCDVLPEFCIRVSYVWAPDSGFDGPVPSDMEMYCDVFPGFCISLGEPIPGTPDRYGDVIRTLPVAQNFSVLRTGTGDLDLIASRDIALHSLYGVYTAGMSTASRGGAQAGAFNQARSTQADGTHLGTGYKPELPPDQPEPGPRYESLVDGGARSTYAAWYPDHGGNLLLRAGGDLIGDIQDKNNPVSSGQDLRPQRSSADISNWLWRQGTGGTPGVGHQPTSWWLNFGSYVAGATPTNQYLGLKYDGSEWHEVNAIPELVGFTGFGALGGGNVGIDVQGDAGLIQRRGISRALMSGPHAQNYRNRSSGLIVAVGSTGRVLDSGELVLTGGGDLNVNLGGRLNPSLSARADTNSGTPSSIAGNYSLENLNLNGVLSNLRGSLQLRASALGGMALQYYKTAPFEVDAREARAFDPQTASIAMATGGPVLAVGDATATLNTRGDLVLAGTGDAGRVSLPLSQAYTVDGADHKSGGGTWFSLWTDQTAIGLISAGGHLTPSVQIREVRGNEGSAIYGKNHSASDSRFIWPSQLHVLAAQGNVYLGRSALASLGRNLYDSNPAYSLLLAPSNNARLSILAQHSIYGGGYVVSRSAASPEVMPTPLRPAFTGFDSESHGTGYAVTNLAADAVKPHPHVLPLFAFGPNTVGSRAEFAFAPARFYAHTGDLIGVGSGERIAFTEGPRQGQTWYTGAGPLWLRAGRDIVRSGTLLGEKPSSPREMGAIPGHPENLVPSYATGNLAVHGAGADVSLMQAGRDIRHSAMTVAGPGTLEITAGRNIVMAGPAEGNRYGETRFLSLGAVATGDTRPGADIAILAGVGAGGARYADFLNRYLDPARLAQPGTPLADQAGQVAKTYEQELMGWLQDRYGLAAGDAGQARAWFDALPAEQRRIFARQVYFAELRASGREFNSPDSPRKGSYLRGRQAITALFPDTDHDGQAIVYRGDLLMYGGSGVHTDAGGGIQVLTPGGAQTYGLDGVAPPATAGVITRGKGDIQLYARDSILLGQSRIMTTFGGDILAWSARGDINAGRGSRTTVVYTPPRRLYDEYGNVTLSPDVPSTGAGIATLDPIPEVAPGDVDLIAPLGTVDAGEAGVRVSGSINVAALHVVNAANIQVQGESTGIPIVAAVNVGALSSASSAASTATQTAGDVLRQQQAAARQNQPSVISVQILGFGEETL